MDASTDVVGGRIGDKKFHMTLVDNKPAVIARDLIVFLLPDELSKTDTRNRAKNLLLPVALFYIDIAPIMPERIYTLLQAKIQTAIDMLEDRTPLPEFLDVPSPFRHDILRLLREWQQPAGAAFATSRLRAQVVFQRRQEKIKRYSMPGNERLETKSSWKKESAFYDLTGILTVPAPYDTVYDDAVKLAYAQYSRNRAAAVDAATSAADVSWKTNVTMIDLDWLHVLGNRALGFPNIAGDPWDLACKISDTGLSIGEKELFKVVTQWFLMTSGALRILKGLIKIEACV